MTNNSDRYKPKQDITIEYLARIQVSKNDFSDRIDKVVKKVNLPPGFYGYTFLGENTMYINDNLDPEQDYKTQIHEAIHTTDEYETRILEKLISKDIKEEIEQKIRLIRDEEKDKDNIHYKNSA